MVDMPFFKMSILDLIPEEDEVFTTYQTIILIRKAQGELILKEIPQIKSPKVLTTVFRWTLNGRKFDIGKTTGGPPLIGDVQLEIFRKKVEERCNENNAISLFEAVTLLEKNPR